MGALRWEGWHGAAQSKMRESFVRKMRRTNDWGCTSWEVYGNCGRIVFRQFGQFGAYCVVVGICLAASKIEFRARGCDLSYCMFVLTCASGSTVLCCNIAFMSRPGSYDTAFRIYQQPVVWCRTVDICKWLVFKRCGQVKLCWSCYWW